MLHKKSYRSQDCSFRLRLKPTFMPGYQIIMTAAASAHHGSMMTEAFFARLYMPSIGVTTYGGRTALEPFPSPIFTSAANACPPPVFLRPPGPQEAGGRRF
jgi:hypothetical protein